LQLIASYNASNDVVVGESITTNFAHDSITGFEYQELDFKAGIGSWKVPSKESQRYGVPILRMDPAMAHEDLQPRIKASNDDILNLYHLDE